MMLVNVDLQSEFFSILIPSVPTEKSRDFVLMNYPRKYLSIDNSEANRNTLSYSLILFSHSLSLILNELHPKD